MVSKVIAAVGTVLLLCVFLNVLYFYFHLNPTVNTGPIPSHNWKSEKPFENLVWMIQISDIHLSKYRDQSRLHHFSEFCNITLNVIKPSVVIASGDITDGASENGYLTYQIEDEWKFYREVLNKNRVPEKLLWLDIRGNHDNFDVLSVMSNQNYFLKYGVQGWKHPKHYSTEYKMASGDLVTFIAVDECLNVGIRRPFNFIGSLNEPELRAIETFSKTSLERNSSHVIWFGHYPTSTILSPGRERLHDIIKSNEKSVAYLSGHLHTLGGLLPQMYAYQNGFFELEVGDWKYDRTFRIMALDNGQFAFVDVVHNDWPYILVTHPKTALLASEDDKSVSDVDNIYPQIRLLAFSPANITEVNVQIDGSGKWEACTHANGPLYVLSWNASFYKDGLHEMKVNVKDADGHDKVVTHRFSLDGSRIRFGLLGRIILMCNVYSMFQSLFFFMVFLSIVPFILMRFLNLLITRKIIEWKFHLDHDYYGLRRFWIMSNTNAMFYPLVSYPIYVVLGPWYIMELLDGKLGVVFSWGIWIYGTYIPESPAYFLGLFHLLVFHVPAVLLIASAVDKKAKKVFCGKFRTIMLLSVCTDILFLVLCTFMLYELYFFWRMEGLFTVVFCPLQTWWLLLMIWLRQVVKTLPAETIVNATRHWKKPGTADCISSEPFTNHDRKLTPLEST